MPHGDSTTYIRTYSGAKYWPLDPRPEDVRLIDIAHSLANQCRFTGHTRKRYSIAEHVCRMAMWAAEGLDIPRCPLWGPEFHLLPAYMFAELVLHHDDPEAYLNDLSRPVKHSPQLAEYRNADAENEAVINKTFGLYYSPAVSKEIKDLDRRMLSTEQSQLMRGSMSFPQSAPLPIKLKCWGPARAKYTYLWLHFRFNGLGRWETFKAIWKERM